MPSDKSTIGVVDGDPEPTEEGCACVPAHGVLCLAHYGQPRPHRSLPLPDRARHSDNDRRHSPGPVLEPFQPVATPALPTAEGPKIGRHRAEASPAAAWRRTPGWHPTGTASRPAIGRGYLRNREIKSRSVPVLTRAITELRRLENARLAALSAAGFVPVPEFARVKPELVVCAAEGCENTFERRQDSKRKFCSNGCRYQIRETTRHCEVCGTESLSKASYASYCSVTCRNKAGHQNARKREREMANA